MLEGHEQPVFNRREIVLITHSPEETQAYGKTLGALLGAKDVVCLSGELGSGKTCMVRGIAQGLEIEATQCVRSPAYTLINEYAGTIKLYHIDLFRVESQSELDELAYRDYLDNNALAVIEWGEKFPALLPPLRLDITLKILDTDVRKICIYSRGKRYEEIGHQVKKALVGCSRAE